MIFQQDTITLNGDKIAYYTVGDPSNPPFLFVHGWSSYYGVWHNTIEALCDSYFCVALDLLGFGASDKPRQGDYSIQAQGRRILALADTLNIERFYLAGHSMGGQIALCIASMLAPERVIKLVDVAGVVAASGAPEIERAYTLGRINYYAPIAMPLMRWISECEWLARRLYGLLFHDWSAVPFETWTGDRQKIFQHGAHIGIYTASTAIHELDLTDRLSSIIAPTLVIFGDDDHMVPIKDGLLANERISQSNLMIINACGHFPMYEHTTNYLEAIRQFLEDEH